MQKPEMILFDYGQTLLNESSFSGLEGVRALMKHMKTNPFNKTAEELHAFTNELEDDIGRFRPETYKDHRFEIHNHSFQKYLYEYWGIEFDIPPVEVEKTFWNSAAPGVMTSGIDALLSYLDKQGIRTGVVSNISFSGEALRDRIERVLSDHHFEFIIATSEYVFRKPEPRIYKLALQKAGLEPDKVWYCGDSPYFDVEGASACGITPVWYTGALRMKTEPPACKHLEIADWRQMIDLLRECE